MPLPAAAPIPCSRRHSRLPLALAVSVLVAPMPPKAVSPTPAHASHGRGPRTGAQHAEHAAVLRLVPTAEATDIAVRSGSWTDPDTWRRRRMPGPARRCGYPPERR